MTVEHSAEKDAGGGEGGWADHYAEAMRLLGTLNHFDASRDFPSDPAGRANATAEAQVHATLALAAALGVRNE